LFQAVDLFLRIVFGRDRFYRRSFFSHHFSAGKFITRKIAVVQLIVRDGTLGANHN
jgi:hypothetical protein